MPTDYRGPSILLAEERDADGFDPKATNTFTAPVVVKGAVRAWDAWALWSFDRLADLRYPDGKEAHWRIQQGLVEQGGTKLLTEQPVAPYLRELADEAETPASDKVGLLPEIRRKTLKKDEPFFLNWDHMRSFKPNKRYLADWPVLQEFPSLRKDFDIRTLWPRNRWTWEYMFVGPANTVTGFHQDIHDNWFCQVRGTKEVILIPADQSGHMFVSRKYNLGSVLSEINISDLSSENPKAVEFAKTRGIYARVEAGDALYIPKNTWHAVVSLEPSISLATFGLTAFEAVTAGAWAEVKHLLHHLRLYRWRNCVCHDSRA